MCSFCEGKNNQIYITYTNLSCSPSVTQKVQAVYCPVCGEAMEPAPPDYLFAHELRRMHEKVVFIVTTEDEMPMLVKVNAFDEKFVCNHGTISWHNAYAYTTVDDAFLAVRAMGRKEG